MIIHDKLLKLSTDTTPDEPETGVIFDSPGIEGLVCYKIVIAGSWRGEGKLLERDVDQEAVRRLWAQLDDCKRHDEEKARPALDEAHHFPSQFSEPGA